MEEWTEPQLTILTRGKNEESVLNACKSVSVEGLPTAKHGSCIAQPTECTECHIVSSS